LTVDYHCWYVIFIEYLRYLTGGVVLELTTMAADKIKEVLVEEGAKESSLRVIAMPSDNGSVQYMLTLEQDSQPDDTPVTLDGLKFLVDSDSAPYLEKATIDFVEDLTRAGFIISNPDFPTTSGCGSGGCGCGSGGGGCGSGSGEEAASGGEAVSGGCGSGSCGCGS